MASTSNECQLQLVLQTFEKNPQFNICKTIRFYNIFHSILSIRINDVSIYVITIANSQKLTALKEEVIVREIFDLDLQGFPSRIYDVKNMANRLLTIYNTIRIGPR